MPFSGEVTRSRVYKRTLSGILDGLSGAVGLARDWKRSLSGQLSFTGDLTTMSKKIILGGFISFVGSVSRVVAGAPIISTPYRSFRSMIKSVIRNTIRSIVRR